MTHLPMPPRLETERLMLQRLKYEDAEEIFYSYACKSEATRFVSWPTHRSIDDTRRFLRYAIDGWRNGTDYTYSVRLKNGMLIGSIGLVHAEGRIQIGYVFGPAHWGRGYATEVCVRVLSELKPLADVYRVGTFVDAENKASIRVLEKCGLIEEAILPRWFRFVNQGNVAKDCVLFRVEP